MASMDNISQMSVDAGSNADTKAVSIDTNINSEILGKTKTLNNVNAEGLLKTSNNVNTEEQLNLTNTELEELNIQAEREKIIEEGLDGSHSETETENENVLCEDAKEIIQKLTNAVPRPVVNILVVGRPGVGKSSLINSLIMALNPDGYQQIARYGSYGGSGYKGSARITVQLRHYEADRYIMSKDPNLIKCKPVFWECPGLQDENDENMKKILLFLLDGKIPAGQDPDELRGWEVKKFSKKFCKEHPPNSDEKIHIMCFVQSSEILETPTHLLEAVNATALQSRREVPVVLVITKMDMLKKRMPDYEKNEIYLNFISKLQQPLGLVNVNEMLINLSSYCEDLTPVLKSSSSNNVFQRKHEIDKDMCRLWRILLTPAHVCKEDYSGKKEKKIFGIWSKPKLS